MRHHMFTSNEACKIPLQITLNEKQLLNVLFWPEKKHFFLTLLLFYFHWFSLFWKTHKLSTIFKRKKNMDIFCLLILFFLKDNFDSIKNFWWIWQICIAFYHHPLSLDRISLFCYKMVKNLCLRLWIVVENCKVAKIDEKRIEKFEPLLSRIFSKDVLDLLLSASSRWNFVCLKQFRTELDVEYTDSIMVRCQETNWRVACTK